MGLGAIYGNMFSNFIVGTNAYGSPDMTDAERKNLSMSIDEMLVGCVYNQNSFVYCLFFKQIVCLKTRFSLF